MFPRRHRRVPLSKQWAFWQLTLGWLLMATRMRIDKLKTGTSTHRRITLLTWNRRWLAGEAYCSATLWILSANFQDLRTQTPAAIFIGIFAFWRINEIVFAFYNDSISRLSGVIQQSTLTSTDRLKMLFRSYGSLIICFASLYYFLPQSADYICRIKDFGDALYLSAVTMTGLGQEGLEIIGIARFLVVYQVLTGILLVVIAVSVYLQPREPIDNSSR